MRPSTGSKSPSAQAGVPVIVITSYSIHYTKLYEVDTVEAAVDRIEAVGDVREEDRLLMLQQRLEGVRQHLVRPVAHENVGRGEAVESRHRLLQGVGVGIRIEAQGAGGRRRDGRQRLGRRRIGILVGVQLDQVRLV